MVFDSNLYYQDGTYRTPTMMNLFTHNSLEMKEKWCSVYEKKRDDFSIIPLSGLTRTIFEHLYRRFVSFGADFGVKAFEF